MTNTARDLVHSNASEISGALGLHALVDGLIQNWLLEPDTFNLVTAGMRALDAYLAGLGFTAATSSLPRGG